MKKLTRKKGIEIIKKFISSDLKKEKWYQNIKHHIKAIVFYGSTAKELNKPDSDLDILIFVPLEIEHRYTKGEYYYSFNKRKINIVLRSIERLRKIAKENKNRIEAEVFRDSEIIFESDSEVRILIRKIKGNRKENENH